MQQCPQTDTQSVHQHGISVKNHLFQLINFLKTQSISNDWRLPDWIYKYRLSLLSSLYSEDIIAEYAEYHDCGKPYCLSFDQNGKKHFPNHAEHSYHTWLSVGGNPQAAQLMKMDMLIHTINSSQIEDFAKQPEAITLLLAGLAEIHSNCQMFGGIQSTSFKIKYKKIEKYGKKICQILYGE